MAQFTFKRKNAQLPAHTKELPLMKKGINYKGYIYRGYLVLVLGLLLYIAYKVS